MEQGCSCCWGGGMFGTLSPPLVLFPCHLASHTTKHLRCKFPRENCPQATLVQATVWFAFKALSSILCQYLHQDMVHDYSSKFMLRKCSQKSVGFNPRPALFFKQGIFDFCHTACSQAICLTSPLSQHTTLMAIWRV